MITQQLLDFINSKLEEIITNNNGNLEHIFIFEETDVIFNCTDFYDYGSILIQCINNDKLILEISVNDLIIPYYYDIIKINDFWIIEKVWLNYISKLKD